MISRLVTLFITLAITLAAEATIRAGYSKKAANEQGAQLLVKLSNIPGPVSRATVYRWIESGQIATILTIRPYKIRREEVERLLRQAFIQTGAGA
jgi:excisionase family DNA binding protein